MADHSQSIITDLTNLGITRHDALIIADCIVTRKSCSWMNSDDLTDKMLAELNHLIAVKDYRISVKVDSVATRTNYIWDVKVLP